MPSDRLSRSEVQRLLGVSEEFLLMLEREAIAVPDGEGSYQRLVVERVRICWTLHNDLQVNLAGQEVILHLLGRLEQERRQFQEVLRWLQQRLEEGATESK